MKAITLKAARIVGPMTLDIDWSTGETLRADLAGWLRPPFNALNDPALFAQMQVDDWGGGLNWPDGFDLGADTLYELCRQQAGLPTASEFDAWMKRNGLSLQTAADSLGMTRRMIAYYRTGSRAIPRVVGLACKGWEVEHRRVA
ncbi:DUF2442 domain-containing protein [Zoogloea sp.]|uniref:DUF2442 domain-containing protein n=1 Tax=Zoogloea sp. TaxID=49181 RepID=UPI00258FBF59|nr:DUF2442 domain-containing protein [Zoogloea sp.]MDD2670103.1 DUF2442 domain-containing protein [Zoogloea sp.]